MDPFLHPWEVKKQETLGFPETARALMEGMPAVTARAGMTPKGAELALKKINKAQSIFKNLSTPGGAEVSNRGKLGEASQRFLARFGRQPESLRDLKIFRHMIRGSRGLDVKDMSAFMKGGGKSLKNVMNPAAYDDLIRYIGTPERGLGLNTLKGRAAAVQGDFAYSSSHGYDRVFSKMLNGGHRFSFNRRGDPPWDN